MIEFKLTGDYIELISLLKFLRIAETGGHAKMMVDEGLVTRNGETEYRRRAKLRSGDILLIQGKKIIIL